MAPLKPGLCSSLTEEIVEKLKRLGIKSVVDFVCEPAVHLSKRAGLPLQDVQSIRQSLIFQFGSYPVSGREIWEEESARQRLISSGCPGLDKLMGGGVVTGQLTEVCGPPATGKTQLCLAVTASVVMTTSSTAVYIDSGCDFSSTWLIQVMRSKGVKDEDQSVLLKRIKVCHVTDVFELLDLLNSLRENITSQVDCFHSNLRLVIIDSITLFISPLLGGKQFHGHALMTQISMTMKLLASEHSVAVVYSNNVVVDFDKRGVMGSSGVKPALGRTWTYVPSTRLMLSQQKCPTDDIVIRVATVTKSSTKLQLVGAQANFSITENGLESFSD